MPGILETLANRIGPERLEITRSWQQVPYLTRWVLWGLRDGQTRAGWVYWRGHGRRLPRPGERGRLMARVEVEVEETPDQHEQPARHAEDDEEG